MTAEEYFAMALPTPEDFEKWTKSFFVRADKSIENAQKYIQKLQKEFE